MLITKMNNTTKGDQQIDQLQHHVYNLFTISIQLRGIAGRINGTTIRAARATISSTEPDHSYWLHAVCNAVLKFHLIPHKGIQ